MAEKSEYRSRITNVEATELLKFSSAAPEIGLYIDFGAPFLLLFWRSKKVKDKLFKKGSHF